MAPFLASSAAAVSTWPEARLVCCEASVTPPILAETSLVPAAACCTLREISWVAAPCSSTAEAMAVEISLTRPITWVMSRMAVAEVSLDCWMERT